MNDMPNTADLAADTTQPAVVAQPAHRSRARLFTFVKITLSALALCFLALKVDLAAVWRHMAGQSLWLVAAALIALSAQIVLGALRWRTILESLGARAPLPELMRVFYVAAFFSNWMWGGAVAGDGVRAWLSVRMQMRVMRAVTSVILDRAVAVAGVAILVILTAPLFAAQLGDTATTWTAWAAWTPWAPAAAAGALLIGIGVATQMYRLPLNWHRHRLLGAVQTLSVETREVFFRPGIAIVALGLAVAAQFAMSLAAYALAWSMDIDLSLTNCLVLIQPVVLATALPISVGGWGVRETAMIALLALVGVPASAALALSVQLGLLSMVAALPGLALWLRLKTDPHSF
jgi:glycosyltransferase 2 family protein